MAKNNRKTEAGKRNNGTMDDDKVTKGESRENKYTCTDCQTKEKPDAATREIDPSAEKNLRKCWDCDCDKAFESLSGLRKHRINIHKTNPELVTFKCQWCSKSFYSKGGLKQTLIPSSQVLFPWSLTYHHFDRNVMLAAKHSKHAKQCTTIVCLPVIRPPES